MIDESLRAAARRSVNGESLPAPWDPVPVSDLLFAFPARVGHLMPDPDDIPVVGSGFPWVDFAHTWFANRLPDSAGFVFKERVGDPEVAYRHLGAILRSFQPKHEHKMAAIAFLASLWLDAVVDTARDNAVLFEKV